MLPVYIPPISIALSTTNTACLVVVPCFGLFGRLGGRATDPRAQRLLSVAGSTDKAHAAVVERYPLWSLEAEATLRELKQTMLRMVDLIANLEEQVYRSSEDSSL